MYGNTCPYKYDKAKGLEHPCNNNECQCWDEERHDCGLKAQKSVKVSVAR